MNTELKEEAFNILIKLYAQMRDLKNGESLLFDNSVEVFRITKIKIHETTKD